MIDALNMLIAGLVAGSVYAMIGMGYNVMHSATKVFNLSQGDFLMMGMMTGLTFVVTAALPLPLAVIMTLAAVSVVALIGYFVAIRPVMGKSPMAWVLSTLSFAFVIRSLAEMVWGSEPQRMTPVLSLNPIVIGGGVRVIPHEMLILATVFVVGIALQQFYRRSVVGRAMRAMSQDVEAAYLRGVPVTLLYIVSIALGASVAGLGGFLIAPLSFAFPTVGVLYTFKGFIATAIGGIGDNRGAVIGGLTLGLVEILATNLIGAGYRNAMALVYMLVWLLILPNGIFGPRAVRKV